VGSKYPLGNNWDPGKGNVREGGRKETSPVGLYSPGGDSPCGCVDLFGIVWEWTATSLNEEEELFLTMGSS